MSGIPAVGKAAPSFATITDADRKAKLSDYKGRWLVLFFYPKDDTPG